MSMSVSSVFLKKNYLKLPRPCWYILSSSQIMHIDLYNMVFFFYISDPLTLGHNLSPGADSLDGWFWLWADKGSDIKSKWHVFLSYTPTEDIQTTPIFKSLKLHLLYHFDLNFLIIFFCIFRNLPNHVEMPC